jgi:predicted component of type VI protein secretion system
MTVPDSRTFDLDEQFDLQIDAGGGIAFATGSSALQIDLAYRLVDGLQPFLGTIVDATIERDITAVIRTIVESDSRVASLSNVTVDRARTDELSLSITATLTDDDEPASLSINVAEQTRTDP